MRKLPFGPDTPRGFFVDSVRLNSIRGRYIERQEGTREFLDPLGRKVSLAFVSYETTSFVLTEETPSIELLNSPRSAKKFLMTLAEMSGFGIAIAGFTVDLLLCLKKIRLEAENVVITRIDCGNLSVTESTFATVKFYGADRVFQDSTAFLKKFNYRTDLIAFSCQYLGRPFRATIEADGKVSTSAEATDPFAELLRRTVAESLV